jgi:hypothetical protein
MLGLQYTQPGGIRTLSGKWNLTGKSRTGKEQDPSDQVTGTGGKALTELRAGNTFTAGNLEYAVASVESDNAFTITAPWGGPDEAGIEIYASGLKPDAAMTPEEAKAAGVVLSGAARPFYKSPLFIVAVIAGLALTFYFIRRRTKKR